VRLSLTKAAYAVASSAAYRKSGFSAGKQFTSGVYRAPAPGAAFPQENPHLASPE
jgi:hypothetical protein